MKKYARLTDMYEKIIMRVLNVRGGISKINAANQALHDFMDYVNSNYSDNGNTVSLRMDSVLKELEGRK